MSELLKDPMVLRSIIMDHYEYPRNHELCEHLVLMILQYK